MIEICLVAMQIFRINRWNWINSCEINQWINDKSDDNRATNWDFRNIRWFSTTNCRFIWFSHWIYNHSPILDNQSCSSRTSSRYHSFISFRNWTCSFSISIVSIIWHGKKSSHRSISSSICFQSHVDSTFNWTYNKNLRNSRSIIFNRSKWYSW